MTPTQDELELSERICERVYGVIISAFGGACKINRVAFVGMVKGVILDEVLRMSREVVRSEYETEVSD